MSVDNDFYFNVGNPHKIRITRVVMLFVLDTFLYVCCNFYFHWQKGRELISLPGVRRTSLCHSVRALTFISGVRRGSMVKCLNRNTGVLGSSRTGSSEFFAGVSLGKTLQSPSLVLVKPRKDMNNVICRRDMTEILLKVA